MTEIQVGAFSSPRLTGQPVSMTTAREDGSFGLSVPPGSWYLHAVGGPSKGSGFLEGMVWGSHGGIYGHGLPIAVCHTPVRGLQIHVSPLWRDLTHVSQHRQPAVADQQRALVLATKAALARDLAETRVSDLEGRIGLSRSRLSSLFRRATGLTLVEYRKRVRLEAAKALLVQTEATPLEIALEVGYSTASALTRAFLPSVGVSPTEFRRLAREVTGDGDVRPSTPEAISAAVDQLASALSRVGGRITGELLYEGVERGAVLYLFAIPRPDPTAYPALWTALPGPGPFTLEAVPPGRYFLTAYYCRQRMRYPGDLRSAFASGRFGSEAGDPREGRPIILTQGQAVGPLVIRLGDGAEIDQAPVASVRTLLAEVR